MKKKLKLIKTKQQLVRRKKIIDYFKQFLSISIFIMIIAISLTFLFWLDLQSTPMDYSHLNGGKSIEDFFNNDTNSMPPILFPPDISNTYSG